jgi:hypothetical protein
MKFSIVTSMVSATIFFGLWQNDIDAAGFAFALMLFIASLVRYIKGMSNDQV